MNGISQRALGVDSSGIRKVFDLAAKLKDPVNLSIGLPDFDAFPEVKQGAHEAIDSRRNGYTQTQGIAELRTTLSDQLGLANHKDLSLFITSGVSGGIFLSYMALLDPGDEVIIPDPYFCMYRDLATLINAVPKCCNCYPDFKLREEEIERQITPRTKALLVCSPGNPTGYAVSKGELNMALAVAKRHGLWLLFDEIYSKFSYDQEHHTPFGEYEKLVVLNGFSKSHGITGWRVGYVVAPTYLVEQMCKLQQYSFVCAPSIAQWGVLKGLDTDFSATLIEYRMKRDFMYEALSGVFRLEKPNGAFYLFPEAPGGSGQKFIEKCVENGLLVVPGNVFSQRDTHFRISFSASMSQLERGAEILNRLAKEY